MTINRRKFLLGGAAVVAVGGLGAYFGGRLGLERHIVAMLQRRLSFLRLDRQGVRTFAHDQVDAIYNKHIPTWNRLKYHFISATAPSFKRYYHSTDQRSRMTRMDDTFISTYLLSSDFLNSGADESRVVHYVAYYDPMIPCGNPFARPAVDAPAVAS